MRHPLSNKTIIETKVDAEDADGDEQYVRTSLRLSSRGGAFPLLPLDNDDFTSLQYSCHGHMRGLTPTEWLTATGSLGIKQFSHDRLSEEQADDDGVTVAAYPTSTVALSTATASEKALYRLRQQVEIRRLGAVAARLAMLDDGVCNVPT